MPSIDEQEVSLSGLKKSRDALGSVNLRADLETEKFSEALREKQFDVLKEAQGKTLDIQYWHDFLKSLRLAGYMSKKMLTSDNNLIFSYQNLRLHFRSVVYLSLRSCS